MKSFLLFIILFSSISCDLEEALGNKDDDNDHREHRDYYDDLIEPSTCYIQFLGDGTSEEALCIEVSSRLESEDCQRIAADVLTSSVNNSRLSLVYYSVSSVSQCSASLSLSDGTNTNNVNHTGFCSVNYDEYNIQMYFYGLMVFGNTINNETDCSNIFSGTYTNP